MNTSACISLAALGLTLFCACSDHEPTKSDGGPDVVLLGDEVDDIAGVAGTYRLTARGRARPGAVMDIPEGFSSLGPWMVWPFDDGTREETARRSERLNTGPSTGSTPTRAPDPVPPPRLDERWTTL